jgi:hypothetical protein
LGPLYADILFGKRLPLSPVVNVLKAGELLGGETDNTSSDEREKEECSERRDQNRKSRVRGGNPFQDTKKVPPP